MRDRGIEKRIADMKEVILAIHRSAGELDTIVQRMENALKIIDKEAVRERVPPSKRNEFYIWVRHA